MSNYWNKRAARKSVERGGRPVSHPDYPDWVFMVRQKDGHNVFLARAILRLRQQPEVAAYLKRVSDPDYAPDAKQAIADADIDARMVRHAFAEGCIAGWEGVTDHKGKVLPAHVANICKVLDEFDTDIFPHLVAFAADAENYKPRSEDEKEKIVSGNSEPA